MKIVRMTPLFVVAALVAVPAAGWAQGVSPGSSVERLDVPRAVAAAVQTDTSAPAWQAQLDAAKARRSAGRKEQFTGLGIMLFGIIHNSIVFSSDCVYANCPRPNVGSAFIGLGAMVTGTVLGIAGGIKAHDADGEVNALIARGPGVGIGLGRGVSLAYKVAW